MSLTTRVSDKRRLSNGNLRLKVTVASASGKIPGSGDLAKMRAQLRALVEEGIVSEATVDHLPKVRERVKVLEENSSGELEKMFAKEMVFTMEVKS